VPTRRASKDPAPARRPRRRWRRNPVAKGDGGSNGSPGAALDAEASEQERIIIEALADLRDMDVREVMTPRVDVTYLTIPVHADDIAQAVRTSGHSCFPVVHDDLDDLIGILFVNDIFRTGGRDRRNADLGARERDATDPSPLEISRKVRQPHLVPESLGVLEALADMRKHRRAVAVVVDEYGGVAGILTVKDLLEPLVGELHDEFDEDEEALIVRVDNTRWLIDGQTNVDEIRDRLGMEIPEGEYVTLGGLLFERFGHIPAEGEEVHVGDWSLRVVGMDKRRVAQVVATFVGQGEVPGPPGGAGGANAVAGEVGGAHGTRGARERSDEGPSGETAEESAG
jgi:CBS domain containing-hemolysin-like protein